MSKRYSFQTKDENRDCAYSFEHLPFALRPALLYEVRQRATKATEATEAAVTKVTKQYNPIRIYDNRLIAATSVRHFR